MFRKHNLPEEAQESESLRHGIVDLVLRVPIIHLFPLCQRRLFEQLYHLHGFGVCRPHYVTKDAGAKPSHTHSITGQICHVYLKGRKVV